MRSYAYDCFDRMTSVVQGQSTLQSMTYVPDRCPRHSDTFLYLRMKPDGSHVPSSPPQPKRRERGASAHVSGAEALRR